MKTRSKYNVGKKADDRIYNGIVFDSAVEMKYYRDVIVPEMECGNIVYCERQKRYILQSAFTHLGKKIQPIEYKADFYIIDKNGKEIVIDIKGCPDPVAKLKRKMFWHAYPSTDYVWIVYSKVDGGWVTYETAVLGRKERKKAKRNI